MRRGGLPSSHETQRAHWFAFSQKDVLTENTVHGFTAGAFLPAGWRHHILAEPQVLSPPSRYRDGRAQGRRPPVLRFAIVTPLKHLVECPFLGPHPDAVHTPKMPTDVVYNSSVLCFLGIVCFVIWRARFARSVDLPPGPRPLPLVGNFFNLPRKREWEVFTQWKAIYGTWGTSRWRHIIH